MYRFARSSGRAGIVLCIFVAGANAALNIETVPVGNPGNAADMRYNLNQRPEGFGRVNYDYRIGKYEVTAGQYTDFLNKVAGVDTYGLYNPLMWSDSQGCKINRYSGEGTPSNPYRYSVASDWANRPVNYVSYWDACRFTNWLHNDQPTGAQGAGTTERGAYTLDGYNGKDGRTIQRNAGAQWFIPTEDEWYKAAYHKNDGVTGNYFDYPTSSNTPPSNLLVDPDPGNTATFWSGKYTIGSPYYRTEVGAHKNSDSPYGTFDQGGNVGEYSETVVWQNTTYGARGLRGVYYGGAVDYMRASCRSNNDPSYEWIYYGFRVAEVPEPATLSLLTFGGLILLRGRRQLSYIGHASGRSALAFDGRVVPLHSNSDPLAFS